MLAVVVLPLLAAAQVAPSPAYLSCRIASPSGNNAVTLDVTLDEKSGTASYVYRETGYALNDLPATFTAASVRWERTDLGPIRYVVGRVDLRIQETWYNGNIPSLVRTGTCEIAGPAKRKF